MYQIAVKRQNEQVLNVKVHRSIKFEYGNIEMYVKLECKKVGKQ